MTAIVKWCRACLEPLSLEEFRPARHRPDGRSGVCRDCTSMETQARFASHSWRTRRGAVLVCLCAEPVQVWGHQCQCGYPVVGLMHPDSQTKMDAKWTGWRDQHVTLTDGTRLDLGAVA